MCKAYRVRAGGGSVHNCGAFHSGAKSPLVLPNRCLTSELYRATPHRGWVVLQQGNITKMVQSTRSSDCNPIEHIWDELGHAITSMENPPQNLGEPHQALSDKWAQITAELLQRLVASMPQCLVATIAARCGNTRYWPCIQKKNTNR